MHDLLRKMGCFSYTKQVIDRGLSTVWLRTYSTPRPDVALNLGILQSTKPPTVNILLIFHVGSG